MFHKIWSEYWNAFRISNIKKALKGHYFYSIWVTSYLLLILPSQNNIYNSLPNTVTYALLSLLILFSTGAALLYPIKLPKMMFLCPLSQKERQNYIKSCYLLKCFIPIVLLVLILLILLGLGYLQPPIAVFIFIIFFLTSLGLNLKLDKYVASLDKQIKVPKLLTYFEAWYIFHYISGVLILFFTLAFSQELSSDNYAIFLSLAFISLFWMLLLTAKLLSFYRPIMMTVTNYETAISLSGMEES